MRDDSGNRLITIQSHEVKRFRRWLFNGAVAISALLCVTTLCFWVRSHKYMDLYDRDGYSLLSIYITSGDVLVDFETCDGGWQYMGTWKHTVDKPHTYYRSTDPLLQRLGFTCNIQIDEWMAHHVASCPLWLIAVLTGILPIVGIKRRSGTQVSDGVCTSCGYDLRATPDRCPECGTIPATDEAG
jgi:hypothetical protein